MIGISADRFMEMYGTSKGSAAAICDCGLIAAFREGEHWHSSCKDGRRCIEVAFENIDTLPQDAKKCIYEHAYKENNNVIYCAYMPIAHIEDIIGIAGGITVVRTNVTW